MIRTATEKAVSEPISRTVCPIVLIKIQKQVSTKEMGDLIVYNINSIH
jgi:hypothetical protein